jgi:23S rRNA pseudouridine2605 synthase
MSEDRIQKILARAGVASRRAAEELIESGRVTVNGTVATLGDKADADTDAIKLDGKRIHPRTEFHYLLLNKPRAVMSTRHDPEGRPTVMDYVPPGRRKAMVPVGRLDFLTEGLILLTDDGDLAHRVAHPRYGCTKTYEVKVQGRPDDKGLDKLRRGMPIEGKKTAPAEIEPRFVPGESDNSWWTVELSEGRTRQIREMFQRIGHRVMKLRRVAIGPLRDDHLPLGAVRELTEKEVEQLRRSTRGGSGKAKGTAGAKAKGGKEQGKGAGGKRAGGGRKAANGGDRRKSGERTGGGAGRKAASGGKGKGGGQAGRTAAGGGGKGRSGAAGRPAAGGRRAAGEGRERSSGAGRGQGASRGIAGSRIATSGGREGRGAGGGRTGGGKPGRTTDGQAAGGRGGSKGIAGSRLGTGGGKPRDKAGGGTKAGGGKRAGGGKTAGGGKKGGGGKPAADRAGKGRPSGGGPKGGGRGGRGGGGGR